MQNNFQTKINSIKKARDKGVLTEQQYQNQMASIRKEQEVYQKKQAQAKKNEKREEQHAVRNATLLANGGDLKNGIDDLFGGAKQSVQNETNIKNNKKKIEDEKAFKAQHDQSVEVVGDLEEIMKDSGYFNPTPGMHAGRPVTPGGQYPFSQPPKASAPHPMPTSQPQTDKDKKQSSPSVKETKIEGRSLEQHQTIKPDHPKPQEPDASVSHLSKEKETQPANQKKAKRFTQTEETSHTTEQASPVSSKRSSDHAQTQKAVSQPAQSEAVQQNSQMDQGVAVRQENVSISKTSKKAPTPKASNSAKEEGHLEEKRQEGKPSSADQAKSSSNAVVNTPSPGLHRRSSRKGKRFTYQVPKEAATVQDASTGEREASSRHRFTSIATDETSPLSDTAVKEDVVQTETVVQEESVNAVAEEEDLQAERSSSESTIPDQKTDHVQAEEEEVNPSIVSEEETVIQDLDTDEEETTAETSFSTVDTDETSLLTHYLDSLADEAEAKGAVDESRETEPSEQAEETELNEPSDQPRQGASQEADTTSQASTEQSQPKSTASQDEPAAVAEETDELTPKQNTYQSTVSNIKQRIQAYGEKQSRLEELQLRRMYFKRKQSGDQDWWDAVEIYRKYLKDYDGYYDDVLPDDAGEADTDHHSLQIKERKQLFVIVGGIAFMIGLFIFMFLWYDEITKKEECGDAPKRKRDSFNFLWITTEK